MTRLVKRFDTDVRLREIVPYDTIYPQVFRFICELIKGVLPDLEFEHIGSTSVPGLGAKPFIDMLVLCEKSRYAPVLRELETMGFQNGQTPVDTPEKPLRCGKVEYRGRSFNVILHLTPRDSRIHKENVRFREELKANPALAQE